MPTVCKSQTLSNNVPLLIRSTAADAIYKSICGLFYNFYSTDREFKLKYYYPGQNKQQKGDTRMLSTAMFNYKYRIQSSFA